MSVSRIRQFAYFLVTLMVLGPGAEKRATAATSDQAGEWGPVLTWGVQGKHMTLLPDGRVLVWSTGDTARVWDPATGQFILTPATFGDLHCAGQTVLPDGRAAVFGGVKGGPPIGTKVTAIFDPATNSWTQGKLMNYARWYATVTTLPDGRVLLNSGTDENGTKVPIPEVYDPAADSWTVLTGINRVQSYYPFMYVMADGRVFEAGPGQTTFFSDLSLPGTLTPGPSNSYGTSGISESATMYLPGKILRAGGGDPAISNTSIIDMNAPTPAWQSVPPMNFPRRRMNLVLLADGSLMAVGGTRASDDATKAVLEGEIWDPDAKQWTVVAPMAEARMYHSAAVLLPDGRVVSAGGEASGRLNAQIYSPPYLFKGPRPVINSAPSAASYGSIVTISTDAADITSVALIRPGAATHALNMNQLYIPLSFTQGTGQLAATTPANANLAPPGFYLLVIKNSANVPSVASWLQLSADVRPGSVTGAVTDSTNGILPGVTITYNGNSVVTNDSGVYTFDNVPAGTHDFTATASGFGAVTKTLHVDAGGLATLDFQLSAPGNIQGVVRDAVTSSALAGATVGYAGGTVTTDSNGAYSINSIAAGSQRITAVIAGYQSAESIVNVPAGSTTTQDFALSVTRTEIDGNISDAVTTAPIAGSSVSYSGGGSTTSNALGQFMFMNVSPGNYTVTVTAPGYAAQTHSVSVVNGIISTSDFELISTAGVGPTLTLNPVADAYVANSKPTTNYGTQTSLQLRQGTPSNNITYHAYLQFNVAGLVGPVSSAKLRLSVTDASPDGGAVFDVPSAWTETGINWNNAPQPLSGTPLANAGVVTKGKVVEISLPSSEFTRGNGTYSFELVTTSSDSTIFNSREAATGKPELVLAQGGGTLPSLTADFRVDKQSGTAPLTVAFDSTISNGNPVSWTWDFNNDNIVDSTQQNPSFIYTNPGIYTVKLTIGDGTTTSMVTKTNLVTVTSVPPPPTLTADFRADKQSGSAPLTVNFDSTISTGSPTSWAWDFNNDGIVDSTQANPSFTYNISGSYTVKLTVGNGSTTSTVTKASFVVVSSVPPPPPPGITAVLVADAYVANSKPTTNYGSQATIQLRQGTPSNNITYHSYLQFNISGISRALTSAKLRLSVTDASPDGGSVFDVSNAWTEAGINWNSAPQPTSPALANAAAVTKGKVVEISLPLGEFARGNGTYSFELVTSSSDSAIYNSKQSSSPPQLILTQ